MKRPLTLLVSLLALTLAPAAAIAGETGPVVVPDGKARIAKHRADRRQLVANRFPTKEDLGPGWYLPWEAPKGMPSAVGSEKRFWRKEKIPTGWAQFFGMNEAEIVKVGRTAIDEGFAQMQAAGQSASDAPAALRSFMTKPGSISMTLSEVRKFTILAEQSRVLFALENQELANRIAREMFLAPDPKTRQEVQVRLGVEAIELIGADLRDKTYDEALQTLAREVRSVRRAARMVYLSGEPEAWKLTTTSKQIPAFGTFTVDLYLMAREGAGATRGDLAPEDTAATKQRLTTALRGLMASAREVAKAQVDAQTKRLDEQIATYRRNGRDATALERRREALQQQLQDAGGMLGAPTVDVRTIDLGDNAWIAMLEADLPGSGTQYRKYFGRMRQGSAVVNVTGEGTHPAAQMLDQIQYMLAAMAAETDVFADE